MNIDRKNQFGGERRIQSACFKQGRRTEICALSMLFLASILLGTFTVLGADGAGTNQQAAPFHVGMSSKIFTGYNANDANAAVKTWVRTISMERKLNADPNPTVFRDTAAIARAVSNRAVDCVTMTMDEYWSLHKDTNAKFGAMVGNTRRQGKGTEEYVLVTRKDSGIKTLQDLRGKSLLILESPLMSMGSTWLDTELMENGYPTASNFFSRINGNTRLTKVVLPVFFRQSDASLVTRAGFETLGEMNPQLTHQLHFLKISPPLVPSATFFRSDYPVDELNAMIRELTNIHTTVAGQQLLTVFQTERISMADLSEFNSTLEFLSKHQKLSEAAQTNEQQKTFPISSSPAPTGGGS